MPASLNARSGIRPPRATLPLLLALASACPRPAGAIINGDIQTGYAAVGAIQDEERTVLGAATLIDPWWVLTTATMAQACPGGVFLVGADFSSPDQERTLGEVFAHPSYDPETLNADLALVRLTAPILDVPPIPWLTATSGVSVGSSVTYVGYGQTSPFDDSNRLRRSCVNTICDVYSSQFATRFDTAGPYRGDMGAPALLLHAGTLKIAGLVLYGEEGGMGLTVCEKVPYHAAFISAVLAANPPPASPAPAPQAGLVLAAAPNPFNPSTRIRFEVPGDGGQVQLTVYDLAGRLVRTLVDASLPQGIHAAVWDGRDATGREVGSGTYLARLEFGGKVAVVGMGLVR
jgi:hypothetical protein